MSNVTEVGMLQNKYINLLGLSISEGIILLDEKQKRHIEQHKNDFDSLEDFKFHLNMLPDFIHSPDYIGLHPNGDSIQFIAKTTRHVLLVVRIKKNENGPYWVKSMYPITQAKLNSYIKARRLIQVKK